MFRYAQHDNMGKGQSLKRVVMVSEVEPSIEYKIKTIT
jgi:hypothetical protein